MYSEVNRWCCSVQCSTFADEGGAGGAAVKVASSRVQVLTYMRQVDDGDFATREQTLLLLGRHCRRWIQQL